MRGGKPAGMAGFEAVLVAKKVSTSSPASPTCRRMGLERVADLLTHRFIHLEEPHREAATWQDWLASCGLGKGPYQGPHHQRLRAGDPGRDGRPGNCARRRHYSERLVKTGLLVRLTNHTLRTGNAFYVVRSQDGELTERVRQVRDWLIANAA